MQEDVTIATITITKNQLEANQRDNSFYVECDKHSTSFSAPYHRVASEIERYKHSKQFPPGTLFIHQNGDGSEEVTEFIETLSFKRDAVHKGDGLRRLSTMTILANLDAYPKTILSGNEITNPAKTYLDDVQKKFNKFGITTQLMLLP